MQLDSYADAGVNVAVSLVNELAAETAAAEARARLAAILAIDPPSVAELGKRHVPAFLALAERLREVFADLAARDVDGAKEKGRWRLHHHPADAALVPMWTATCAEALARLIGAGHADRLGTCAREGCGRVFADVSKNGSRRFCSIACQNRVKVAAYRSRSRG